MTLESIHVRPVDSTLAVCRIDEGTPGCRSHPLINLARMSTGGSFNWSRAHSSHVQIRWWPKLGSSRHRVKCLMVMNQQVSVAVVSVLLRVFTVTSWLYSLRGPVSVPEEKRAQTNAIFSISKRAPAAELKGWNQLAELVSGQLPRKAYSQTWRKTGIGWSL